MAAIIRKSKTVIDFNAVVYNSFLNELESIIQKEPEKRAALGRLAVSGLVKVVKKLPTVGKKIWKFPHKMTTGLVVGPTAVTSYSTTKAVSKGKYSIK